MSASPAQPTRPPFVASTSVSRPPAPLKKIAILHVKDADADAAARLTSRRHAFLLMLLLFATPPRCRRPTHHHPTRITRASSASSSFLSPPPLLRLPSRRACALSRLCAIAECCPAHAEPEFSRRSARWQRSFPRCAYALRVTRFMS